jgi:hypothetical protein
MGYRSDGRIYLSNKALELVPTGVLLTLNDDMEKVPDSENEFAFYEWRWYESYPEVKHIQDMFIRFHDPDFQRENGITQEDFDICIIAEDSELIDEDLYTHSKYCTRRIMDYV